MSEEGDTNEVVLERVFLIESFKLRTGINDTLVCVSFLRDANWNLENAIEHVNAANVENRASDSPTVVQMVSNHLGVPEERTIEAIVRYEVESERTVNNPTFDVIPFNEQGNSGTGASENSVQEDAVVVGSAQNQESEASGVVQDEEEGNEPETPPMYGLLGSEVEITHQVGFGNEETEPINDSFAAALSPLGADGSIASDVCSRCSSPMSVNEFEGEEVLPANGTTSPETSTQFSFSDDDTAQMSTSDTALSANEDGPPSKKIKTEEEPAGSHEHAIVNISDILGPPDDRYDFTLNLENIGVVCNFKLQPDDTINHLMSLVTSETGIAVQPYVFTGWPMNIWVLSPNIPLSYSRIPRTLTLTLTREAFMLYKEVELKLRARSRSSLERRRMPVLYTLKVHNRDTSRYHIIAVDARAKVLDVKLKVYYLTDIMINEQRWKGWPPLCTNNDYLRNLDLSSIRMLSFKKGPPVSTPDNPREDRANVGTSTEERANVDFALVVPLDIPPPPPEPQSDVQSSELPQQHPVTPSTSASSDNNNAAPAIPPRNRRNRNIHPADINAPASDFLAIPPSAGTNKRLRKVCVVYDSSKDDNGSPYITRFMSCPPEYLRQIRLSNAIYAYFFQHSRPPVVNWFARWMESGARGTGSPLRDTYNATSLLTPTTAWGSTATSNFSYMERDLPDLDDRSSEDEDDAESQNQTSFIPRDYDSEKSGAISFIQNFESKYGAQRPEFYSGTLEEAIKDACFKPARDRKLLALYLHHNSSKIASVFCGESLCHESVKQFLTTNFVTWGWDVTLKPCRVRLLRSVRTQLGREGARVIAAHLNPEKMPLLVAITRVRGNCEVLSIVDGTVGLNELISRLLQAVDIFTEQQFVEVREEDERARREMEISQQDEAYLASLATDRAKEVTRQEEERVALEEMARLEDAKRKKEARKEAERAMIQKRFPPEPEQGAVSITKLRFRLPTCGLLERRFLLTDTLQVVYDFLTLKSFPMDEYKLMSSYPRRELNEIQKTLQDLKLYPQETLVIEER